MARPKAQVLDLLEHNGEYTELLAVKGIWALTYRDQMFNQRTLESTMKGTVGSYGKTFYSNKGNAIAQSRNLNNKFNCTDFSVKQIYGE